MDHWQSSLRAVPCGIKNTSVKRKGISTSDGKGSRRCKQLAKRLPIHSIQPGSGHHRIRYLLYTCTAYTDKQEVTVVLHSGRVMVKRPAKHSMAEKKYTCYQVSAAVL